MNRTITILLIAFFSISAIRAQTFVVDGIKYNVTSSSDPYTVEVVAGDPAYSGDVVIPATVEEAGTVYTVNAIGQNAFSHCYDLANISLPNTIISIGEYAFQQCSLLYSLTIPNSVSSIGPGAFEGCSNILSVSIPASVTSIGIVAFSLCSFLTSIEVSAGNAFYASIDGVLYDKGITKLIQCPIQKTAVSIPSSVTTIGHSAFFDCANLSSLTIPNSVNIIEPVAFGNCSGISSIVIPSSVTSVGVSGFFGCRGLLSVTIPSSITTIERSAFENCSGLTTVSIPNSITSIGNGAFSGCTNLTAFDVASDNSTYTSVDGVIYDKAINTLILCPQGKSSVDIPETVSTIAERGIFWCKKLTSVKIPNSVTSIGARALSNCTALSSLFIPSSVVSMGDNAIEHCTSLTSLVSAAETPPGLGNTVFTGVPKTIPLYVPAESVDDYKAAMQWRDFNIISPLITVNDVDGNVYTAVRIGNQVWMNENLKTTRYRNGDVIGTTTSVDLDIRGESSPKYQWAYEGDEVNVNRYGRLYTWYTVVDDRNVCPEGWHVPSDQEWTILSDFLTDNGYGFEGSGNDIAKSMAFTAGWTTDPTPGNVGNDQASNNSSLFSGLPGGARHSSGAYNLMDESEYWWSSTENSPTIAHNRFLRHDGWFLEQSNFTNKQDGYAVRCLMDFDKTIYLTDSSYNEGMSVNVPVSVSELTSDDQVIAYQFDINYDHAILEYKGNSITGTLAEGGTVLVNNSVPGKLSISYMNSSPITGAGTILLLQFNPLQVDTTLLNISDAYLNSTPIDDLSNGTVLIKDATPPTAMISYSHTDVRAGDYLLITAALNEPMDEAKSLWLSLNGVLTLSDAIMVRQSETVYTYTFPIPDTPGIVGVSLSNGTDLGGNEVTQTPVSGANFTITNLSYGDVDDDGQVLAYDAALTLQHSVGVDPLPGIDPLPWENWRDSTANVDRLGGITANDAGMILQYSAGLITSFDPGIKKSAPQAFISMEFADDGIVFYAYGELLGLNISVDDVQVLGTPVVLTEGFLSAFNISQTSYRIGLCTANPPEDGTAILKIPYKKNGAISVTMVVNTEAVTHELNITTGLDQSVLNAISVYPNPACDILRISGMTHKTTATIYSSTGQLMFSKDLEGSNDNMDVTDLPSGYYILKFSSGQEIKVSRFLKN